MAGVIEEELTRWRREYGIESVLHLSRPDDTGDPADLVMVHPARVASPDWRASFVRAASLATKLLVVLAPNGPRAVRTAVLAPALWAIGRVREHTYVDVPFGLERAPAWLVRRLARSHVFVVDVRPRTRQARRRLQRAS